MVLERSWDNGGETEERALSYPILLSARLCGKLGVEKEIRPSRLPPAKENQVQASLSQLITIVCLLQRVGLFYICRRSGQGSLSVVLLPSGLAHVAANPQLASSPPPN